MRAEQDLNGGRISLHLLDAAQGHPIQTWHFEDQARVRIGRATESEIVLADSRVSRLHVELQYDDGKWVLHSHGRNGTTIDGASVAETRMRDGVIFQLGSGGPSFKFVTVSDEDSSMATIDNFDPSAFDFLEIDEQQKAEEVNQIVDTEAFRQLQERAKRLRADDGACLPETDA